MDIQRFQAIGCPGKKCSYFQLKTEQRDEGTAVSGPCMPIILIVVTPLYTFYIGVADATSDEGEPIDQICESVDAS